MYKRILPLAAVVLMFSGCAQPQKAPLAAAPKAPPSPIKVSAAFDEASARSQMSEGQGMLLGNAFMRQQGGGVVTCAGSPVFLIPATAYAVERMRLIYQGPVVPNATSYRNSLDAQYDAVVRKFDPDPPAYTELTRRAVCDAQGNFSFNGLRDGQYFVSTAVSWTVGSWRQQGGNLASQVEVKGGRVDRLVMAR